MFDNLPDGSVNDDVLAAAGDAQWLEYSKAANPVWPSLTAPVPYHAFLPDLYADGPTRLVPLDLSDELHCQGPATSPGLAANFARILPNETLSTGIAAGAPTLHVFYVIRGNGRTGLPVQTCPRSPGRRPTSWHCPATAYTHQAGPDGATFYLVHDAPLLTHLGVAVTVIRFAPTVYSAETTRAVLDQVAESPEAATRGRISVLLGNKHFP